MNTQNKVIKIVPDSALDKTKIELSKARHLPGNIYTSPEIHDRELDEYFSKDWLFVGRAEQFGNPGDYEALRMFNRPVVIARDKTGKLNAFYNMCRHRGVEVADGKGNTKLFKCPYHGWTYDLNGNLVGAAYMKESEGFVQKECRLPSIHLEVWRGNIFINFSTRPVPFSEAIADLEKDFEQLHMENCRLADLMHMELNCNWKFLHENLMDYYHVGVLHVKTFGARFSWTPENLVLKPNGGLTMRYTSSPSTPDGISRFGKAPWLEHEDNTFACTGFFPPNLTIFGRIDCVKLISAWPDGPNKCKVKIYMLLPEEFFAQDDFEENVEIYRKYQSAIYEEDRSMIESMQLAMSSPVYEPGRMSTMEKPIHHFLNKYAERMFGH